MKITRAFEAPEGPVDAGHFAGDITRRDYGAIESPAGTALLVRFPAGARTDWHRHPDGQVLFVTEGSGRVGTRDDGAVDVRAGDLVYAPPGEEHWHGASEDGAVQHLALSFGDTDWLEPVED
jgi:quercetin dioxygenase-like cupin family protein